MTVCRDHARLRNVTTLASPDSLVISEYTGPSGCPIWPQWVYDITVWFKLQLTRISGSYRPEEKPLAAAGQSADPLETANGASSFYLFRRTAYGHSMRKNSEKQGSALRARNPLITVRSRGVMQATQWHVITGAPSSGKTAIIEALSRRGYQTIPEAARALIDREMAKGKTLPQIKSDILWFERTILMNKVRVEAELPTDKIVFLDRAIPDSMAYYALENLDPAEAAAEARKRRYRRVFMFERLRLTEDGVRSEDDRQAQRLETLLMDAYRSLGYPVLRVPVLPLPERADWIIDRL